MPGFLNHFRNLHNTRFIVAFAPVNNSSGYDLREVRISDDGKIKFEWLPITLIKKETKVLKPRKEFKNKKEFKEYLFKELGFQPHPASKMFAGARHLARLSLF